nr:hypothetical protein CFP56_69326 [Quercus suber]
MMAVNSAVAIELRSTGEARLDRLPMTALSNKQCWPEEGNGSTNDTNEERLVRGQIRPTTGAVPLQAHDDLHQDIKRASVGAKEKGVSLRIWKGAPEIHNAHITTSLRTLRWGQAMVVPLLRIWERHSNKTCQSIRSPAVAAGGRENDLDTSSSPTFLLIRTWTIAFALLLQINDAIKLAHASSVMPFEGTNNVVMNGVAEIISHRRNLLSNVLQW